MVQHLFTVDVEEYFQVAALEPYVPRELWNQQETRLARGVDALLELLARHRATGTFFTLGLLAEQHASVIQRIADAGHEIGSHGWTHKSVPRLGANPFREEVARSRDVLSDLTGQRVIGYRAPNFSIVSGFEWAYDILIEEGYVYDASVFPGRQSGRRETRRGPWVIERTGGNLIEVPMTCAYLGQFRVPSAGGAWFRLFPYSLTHRALRQAADIGEPGVFYIHPWELDPEQPRLRTNMRTRVRHYGGLSATVPRIDHMLSEFRFTSIISWLERNRVEWMSGRLQAV
jgi:polysaccharide deacetylase family protein (PEP-CTERM system associated)